jgi:hypothetical protein
MVFMVKRALLLFLLMIFCSAIQAQGKFILQKSNHDKINFKLINNLIIFPVEVNGVELSFMLDTGVSKPIIFNFLNITEALQINQAERIYIRGLGEGEAIEALKSKNNIFRIGNAININQDLYAVFDPAFNFAPRLGVPIHGIIGYDFLKDFIVEVNYSNRFIKLHKPETYKQKNCPNCETLGLQFLNNKPYIETLIEINGNDIPVTLLIDSGGSDALWLFEDNRKNITIPEKYFDDFLGRGLSGKVFGKRARITSISIKDYKLSEVNVAFPDSSSISFARKFKNRNGSLSGEILKRFNIIFDYPNNKMTFKRNRNFSRPFYYNKSGIELEHDGVRVIKEVNKDFEPVSFDSANQSVATQSIIFAGSYKYVLAPSFKIVELRKNSPALLAGLKVDDVILSINGKHAHTLDLAELIQIFYGIDGKRIKLLIDRKGNQMKFDFKLVSLL